MTRGLSRSFFIGWDVGAWNCDKNRDSRDAIVIVNYERALVGSPWRGNLRESINASADTRAFIKTLFFVCNADVPTNAQVTLAIDTPLGFSVEFIQLVSHFEFIEAVGDWNANPYLFRKTERFLFQHGLTPLSAVKDMIGSQATKGMHVLAKFAPNINTCGVWEDGGQLTAIEAYPSACKKSESLSTVRRSIANWPCGDVDDRTDALHAP